MRITDFIPGLDSDTLSGGLIERGADYDDCVDTSLARLVLS